MSCDHEWLPMFSWVGRYRCDVCNVIGHRNVGQLEHRHGIELIVPYCCTKETRGVHCGAPAVSRSPQLCQPHWDERQAKRERLP